LSSSPGRLHPLGPLGSGHGDFHHPTLPSGAAQGVAQIWTRIEGLGSGKSRSRSRNHLQVKYARWLRRLSHLCQALRTSISDASSRAAWIAGSEEWRIEPRGSAAGFRRARCRWRILRTVFRALPQPFTSHSHGSRRSWSPCVAVCRVRASSPNRNGVVPSTRTGEVFCLFPWGLESRLGRFGRDVQTALKTASFSPAMAPRLALPSACDGTHAARTPIGASRWRR
jgi:hypothetical protein